MWALGYSQQKASSLIAGTMVAGMLLSKTRALFLNSFERWGDGGPAIYGLLTPSTGHVGTWTRGPKHSAPPPQTTSTTVWSIVGLYKGFLNLYKLKYGGDKHIRCTFTCVCTYIRTYTCTYTFTYTYTCTQTFRHTYMNTCTTAH